VLFTAHEVLRRRAGRLLVSGARPRARAGIEHLWERDVL